MGIPIVEIMRSYDRRISTMGLFLLGKRHAGIEKTPLKLSVSPFYGQLLGSL